MREESFKLSDVIRVYRAKLELRRADVITSAREEALVQLQQIVQQYRANLRAALAEKGKRQEKLVMAAKQKEKDKSLLFSTEAQAGNVKEKYLIYIN